MSTPAAKHIFVAWLPDYTSPETLQRRMAVRSKHLEGILQGVSSGTIKLGAVAVTPESIDEQDKKFNGSVMFFEAESTEEVWKIVHGDPYWAENVWDKEKADVRPVLVSPATSVF
ncbi:hypothetical protein BV25DRAFT_1918418 [Artomyces pyxidatus]|uniref:Uncharacterized protein n=1 Tax=Artomyces pyxidatus TaxID=48021 RepID=A0ACB8SSZ6_9AGAM|nr:hypothetical protein BV25DRAFT_1918418 [Artomyces pyxidatus]